MTLTLRPVPEARGGIVVRKMRRKLAKQVRRTDQAIVVDRDSPPVPNFSDAHWEPPSVMGYGSAARSRAALVACARVPAWVPAHIAPRHVAPAAPVCHVVAPARAAPAVCVFFYF